MWTAAWHSRRVAGCTRRGSGRPRRLVRRRRDLRKPDLASVSATAAASRT